MVVGFTYAHPTCFAPGPVNTPTLPPVDCAHIITQISAVEFRPECQERHGILALTVPTNGYFFKPSAHFICGICEVMVDVEHPKTGLWITPPAGHMQFQL